MKKGWRVILIIVLIAFAVGTVSAGVGLLTGADFTQINGILVERVEERFNVDPVAFFNEWLPETIAILRQELTA